MLTVLPARRQEIYKSPTSYLTSQPSKLLFRPRLIVSSEVFKIDFVHLAYSSALLLASYCFPFLLPVVANLIYIVVGNVMAHAQKPDFVFPRNGRVHLNRWGRQFSRLLAAEVCASARVMLDRPRSKVAWEYWVPTPFASFPSLPLPCVTVCHQVPNELYLLSFSSVGSAFSLPKLFIPLVSLEGCVRLLLWKILSWFISIVLYASF